MKVFLCLSLLVALTLAEPPVYRQQSQNERNKYYFARQEAETPADAEAAAPYPASGWKPDGPAFELPQRQQQAAAPQQQYGAPQAGPQKQYGAPAAPQNQYGAPAAPQNQYGAPQAAPQAAPQQQYRQQYRQQQQFRGFAAPQRLAAQEQYAAPSAPQQQYGAPSAPQQGYGAPPQQTYGAPDAVTTTEEPTDSEESTTLPSGTERESEPVESVNELDEEGEVDEQQRQSGQYYVALPDGRLQRVQYMSSQDIEAMKYFARIQAENVEPLRGPIYAYSPLQKLQFAPSSLQIAVNDPYAPAAPVVAIREPTGSGAGRNAKAAPEKLQQQPLAAPVRYDSPAAIVGLTGNGYPVNGEQRYLISF